MERSPVRYHHHLVGLLCSSERCRSKFDDIATLFQADAALPLDSFASRLSDLDLGRKSNIYVDTPARNPKHVPSRKRSILDMLRPRSTRSTSTDEDSLMALLPRLTPKSLSREVNKLRAFKSYNEVKAIKAACDISGRAFAKVCVSAPVSFVYQSHWVPDNVLHEARCHRIHHRSPLRIPLSSGRCSETSLCSSSRIWCKRPRDSSYQQQLCCARWGGNTDGCWV